jgi:hypothetical protein
MIKQFLPTIILQFTRRHPQIRSPAVTLKAIYLNILVKKMQVFNSGQVGSFKVWLKQLKLYSEPGRGSVLSFFIIFIF